MAAEAREEEDNDLLGSTNPKSKIDKQEEENLKYN
jgi:hypothetical protein